MSFYLVQLKVYKIDNSAPAPQLHVVSRPDLQAKIQRVAGEQQTTQIKKWRQEMWQDILEYISDQKPPFNVQSPSDDHWSNIAIGRSGFWIGLTLVPKNQRIGCELAMNVSWKKDAFNQLLLQKEEIEAEIGTGLDWREIPGYKSSRIVLDTLIDSKSSGEQQKVKEWMHKHAVAFYKAFHDRVKNLNPGMASDSVPIDEAVGADNEAAVEYPENDE